MEILRQKFFIFVTNLNLGPEKLIITILKGVTFYPETEYDAGCFLTGRFSALPTFVKSGNTIKRG